MRKNHVYILVSIFFALIIMSPFFYMAIKPALASKYAEQTKYYLASNNHQKAYLASNKLLFLDRSDSSQALYGEYLFKIKNYEDAIKYLEKSDLTKNKNLEMLGISYLRTKDFTSSNESFKKLKNLDTSKKIFNYYITSLLFAGFVEEALIEAKKATKLFKNSKQFDSYIILLENNNPNKTKKAFHYLKSAEWLYNNGYYLSSISLADKSLLFFEHRDTYLIKSQALVALGKHKEGLSTLEKAEDTDKFYPLTYKKMAEIYDLLNNTDKKEEALKKAALLELM